VLPNVRSVTLETLQDAEQRVLSAEPAASPAPRKETLVEPAERPAFDPRFTFDRFVVSTTNRVAFNAARTVAQPGVPMFSPLYLHAGTGQGKTHLMHAIGHAFLEANPGATAIYSTGERFMFEFVQALRNKDTLAFKTRLRSVDLLMIDDLQFIGGKDATQEEFFHTVNEFMSAGKRLVIEAPGNRADTPYVAAVSWNGKPWRKSWISHADLAKGGTLRFTMSAKPNPAFGRALADRPPSNGRAPA